MDARGNIYELSEEELKEPVDQVVKEDIARLEGFLRGRAESDKSRHKKLVKKRGKMIWDSQNQGTYRKSKKTHE